MISAYLVEVDVHALELKVGGAIVDTGAVEAMLAGDGLPESGTNLVTLKKVSYRRDENGRGDETYALTGLEVNLLHGELVSCYSRNVVLTLSVNAGQGRATAVSQDKGRYVQSHACWRLCVRKMWITGAEDGVGVGRGLVDGAGCGGRGGAEAVYSWERSSVGLVGANASSNKQRATGTSYGPRQRATTTNITYSCCLRLLL